MTRPSAYKQSNYLRLTDQALGKLGWSAMELDRQTLAFQGQEERMDKLPRVYKGDTMLSPWPPWQAQYTWNWK